MVALPSRAQIVDALADGPTMAPRFGDLRDFVAQLKGGAAETELTVAAGVITPTGFQHRVDTEGEAGTDNLDQVALTNLPDGAHLMLVPENAARVNTLRHLNGTGTPGTNGEMVLDNAANFALDAADKWIVLRRKGTQWVEVMRSALFGRRLGAAADAAAARALVVVMQAEADVASATTCDIGAAATDNVRITGTTTITGLGTGAAGLRRYVRFAGALTLTHNAASLILPTGENIVTAAGDRAIFKSLGSGNWECVAYQRADGGPLEAAWTDLASATTTDLGAVASRNVRITGTTTITGLGTIKDGTYKRVRFAGALTLTHNATSLILPGGANIATAANDTALFVSLGAGNWICVAYQKASGAAVAAPATGLVPIERKTGSSVASYDFTTGIGGTYRTYVLKGHLIPATDDVELWLRTDANGGASFDAGASDYKWAFRHPNNVGGSVELGGAAEAQIKLAGHSTANFAVGNGAAEGISFEITIHMPSTAAVKTKLHWTGVYYAANDHVMPIIGGGFRDTAQADNAIQLLFESGNIASGDVTLYGVANA